VRQIALSSTCVVAVVTLVALIAAVTVITGRGALSGTGSGAPERSSTGLCLPPRWWSVR